MTKMFNNLTNSPTLFQPIADRAMGHSKPPRPTADAKSCVAMRKHNRALAIVRLFLRCSPPAICWPAILNAFLAVATRIVAFAVNAIYRVNVARLFTHVIQEVDERLSPPFANCYAVAAINFPASLAGVVASRMHLLPRTVFGRHFPLASRPARPGTMAAAGNLVSLPKNSSADSGGIPALAATHPVQFSPLAFRTKFYDCQFTVNVPDFICGIYTSARIGYSGPKVSAEHHGFRATLASTVPSCAAFACSATGNSPLSVLLPSLVLHPGVYSQWTTKAASLAATRREVIPCDKVSGAAVAQDAPVEDLTPSLAKSGHDETSVTLPSKIFEIVGASDRITRRHDSTPRKLDYCESSQATQSSGCSYFSTT